VADQATVRDSLKLRTGSKALPRSLSSGLIGSDFRRRQPHRYASKSRQCRDVLLRIVVEAIVCSLAGVRGAAMQSQPLLSLLIRLEQTLYAQAQQSAACVAAHHVEARLCRWLLRSRDSLVLARVLSGDAGGQPNERDRRGAHASAGWNHQIQQGTRIAGLEPRSSVSTAPAACVRAYASAQAFKNHTDFDGAVCVILDINLNDGSGIELRHRLKADGVSVPVIYITGNENPSVRKAALASGCIAFLTKPLFAQSLIEPLKKASAGR
jgi:CheY-like chemotaxis protein